MASTKNKPRGRINLNFDLTDDAQLAVYHLLRAKGADRCATQWIMSHLSFELNGDGDTKIPVTIKKQEEDGSAQSVQAEHKKSLEPTVSAPAPHTGKDMVQALENSFIQHTSSESTADMDETLAEEVADIIAAFGS